MERCKLGNRCKSLIVIDVFDLGEALCNDSGLILLDGAIRSAFDAENPPAPYYLATFWMQDDLIHSHALKSAPLVVTSKFPLSCIRACHGLCICVWVAHGDILCHCGVLGGALSRAI